MANIEELKGALQVQADSLGSLPLSTLKGDVARAMELRSAFLDAARTAGALAYRFAGEVELLAGNYSAMLEHTSQTTETVEQLLTDDQGNLPEQSQEVVRACIDLDIDTEGALDGATRLAEHLEEHIIPHIKGLVEGAGLVEGPKGENFEVQSNDLSNGADASVTSQQKAVHAIEERIATL